MNEAGTGDFGFEVVPSRGDACTLRLSGRWTARPGIPTAGSIFDMLGDPAPMKRLTCEAVGLADWDSSLVALLRSLSQLCSGHGIELDLKALPEGLRRLVDLSLAIPAPKDAHRTESRPGVIETVGTETLKAVKSGGEMLGFLGECIIALVWAVFHKVHFRRQDVASALQVSGPDALAIVTLISFLMGLILGFIGAVQLQQFGAEIYVANLVGIGMVREIAAMMTAIVMAGRTGAAFAAELGTMQVNEEIRALETFGISPIEFLVLPRMLALIVMLPLLVIYANIVGMFGGGLVAWSMLDITFLEYFIQLQSAVTIGDWVGCMIKAVVFGIIVAVAGCLRGMQCERSAMVVGGAATSAVVTGIVAIIASNAVLTVLYTTLGF